MIKLIRQRIMERLKKNNSSVWRYFRSSSAIKTARRRCREKNKELTQKNGRSQRPAVFVVWLSHVRIGLLIKPVF